MKATVLKDASSKRGEQWHVYWDRQGAVVHVIVKLPTRSRAWAFADLVTALSPLEAAISLLNVRVASLERERNDYIRSYDP
jgi:hypothetical protein